MISLISSLSLKLYLNWLVYRRNIFESSLEVFGNFQKLSETRDHDLKNVREPSSGLRSNFGKSSEIFGNSRKSLENYKKRRHQYVYIIKRTLQVSSKI